MQRGGGSDVSPSLMCEGLTVSLWAQTRWHACPSLVFAVSFFWSVPLAHGRRWGLEQRFAFRLRSLFTTVDLFSCPNPPVTLRLHFPLAVICSKQKCVAAQTENKHENVRWNQMTNFFCKLLFIINKLFFSLNSDTIGRLKSNVLTFDYNPQIWVQPRAKWWSLTHWIFCCTFPCIPYLSFKDHTSGTLFTSVITNNTLLLLLFASVMSSTWKHVCPYVTDSWITSSSLCPSKKLLVSVFSEISQLQSAVSHLPTMSCYFTAMEMDAWFPAGGIGK